MLGQVSTLSLFQLLHERLEPRLPAVRCTRTTLLHLSHKLEDLIRSHQIPAFIFTGFQIPQTARQEIDRYPTLAQVVQQIFIFAEKAEPEPPPNLLYIPMGNLGPLGQEWFVLILAEALIYGVLEKSGYVVLEAGNGLEALEVSRKYPDTVDLLLTDVAMPKIGGRELAGYLASLYPAIKLLYISGYTHDTMVSHGVFDLKTAFLHKPFTPEELIRKVREVLDTERVVGPRSFS